MTDTPIGQIDADQPWAQLPQGKEKDLWYSRFLIFRDMGPVRSIRGAYQIECKRINKKASIHTPSSWRDGAKAYSWLERAKAWDEYKRTEVFNQGYAYELTRIKRLNDMAELLFGRILTAMHNDKEPKKLNPELIDLWLKTLEALAQETGGRVKKKEVSGPNGAPLEVLLFLPEQEQDVLIEDAGDAEEW